MKFFTLRNWFALLALGVLAPSCASDSKEQQAPTPRSLSQRLSESGGYVQDAEGNWKAGSDKRSSYDSQRTAAFFSGNVDKKSYGTKEYGKKSWWGGRNYKTNEYAGNTDGSRFRRSSRLQGQTARDEGQQARLPDRFKTNTLDRESARESSFSDLDRPSSANVESSRDDYQVPSVIDWREQRSLTKDQTKGILGR